MGMRKPVGAHGACIELAALLSASQLHEGATVRVLHESSLSSFSMQGAAALREHFFYGRDKFGSLIFYRRRCEQRA